MKISFKKGDDKCRISIMKPLSSPGALLIIWLFLGKKDVFVRLGARLDPTQTVLIPLAKWKENWKFFRIVGHSLLILFIFIPITPLDFFFFLANPRSV